VRAALEQMDALVAAAGGKPGELAQKVQAEEEAEEAAEDAADAKAHRRSRAIKWLGLTGLVAHWCIFARLTYWRVPLSLLPHEWRWGGALTRHSRHCAPLTRRCRRRRELSWDVMEPAAFLVGQAWIIVSYLYFMVRTTPPKGNLGRQLRHAGRVAPPLTRHAGRLPSLSSATKIWTGACAARSATTPRGCAPSKPPQSAPEGGALGRTSGAPQRRSARLPAAEPVMSLTQADCSTSDTRRRADVFARSSVQNNGA
jgi:hypothetical protein